MIRAKFKVVSKTERMSTKRDPSDPNKYVPCRIIDVALTPVYPSSDPNHENTRFWNASPSGSIAIGCANEAAADAFTLDREYYVDFTEAPRA